MSASGNNIRFIQLESTGALFSLGNNITLKLQNITLKGISDNDSALVIVGNGSRLEMEEGSKITLNTSIDGNKGGGVYVNGGTMLMNSGEICENRITGFAGYGGGIYLDNKGSATIKNGSIFNNKVEAGTYYSDSNGFGGGIYINNDCTVTMNGGTIYGNYVNGKNPYGGGVYIQRTGTFIKRHASGSETSGTIYGPPDSMANTSARTGLGDALQRANGTKHSVNRTLGEFDEITSKSDEGWE